MIPFDVLLSVLETSMIGRIKMVFGAEEAAKLAPHIDVCATQDA